MKQQPATVDTRISQALAADGKVTVDDLQALIPQIETGIREADAFGKQERERSLDPSTSPSDAEQAQQRAGIAELKRDRYKAALTRLREKFSAALHAEFTDRWHADANKVESRVKAAKEQVARYAELTDQIVTILVEAEAVNQEVARVNGAAPDDVQRRVDKVDLEHLKELVLPDLQHPGRNLWPLPKPSLAASYAAMMAPQHDPRYSADWAKAREANANAIREEQARIAAYYEAQTKAQERRMNDEERKRFSRR